MKKCFVCNKSAVPGKRFCETHCESLSLKEKLEAIRTWTLRKGVVRSLFS